jgi:hypothetical protein
MRIEAKQDDEAEDENFLRRLVLPEEDRSRYGIPWLGGYRWFRSPNVIDLWLYQSSDARARISEVLRQEWRLPE